MQNQWLIFTVHCKTGFQADHSVLKKKASSLHQAGSQMFAPNSFVSFCISSPTSAWLVFSGASVKNSGKNKRCFIKAIEAIKGPWVFKELSPWKQKKLGFKRALKGWHGILQGFKKLNSEKRAPTFFPLTGDYEFATQAWKACLAKKKLPNSPWVNGLVSNLLPPKQILSFITQETDETCSKLAKKVHKLEKQRKVTKEHLDFHQELHLEHARDIEKLQKENKFQDFTIQDLQTQTTATNSMLKKLRNRVTAQDSLIEKANHNISWLDSLCDDFEDRITYEEAHTSHLDAEIRSASLDKFKEIVPAFDKLSLDVSGLRDKVEKNAPYVEEWKSFRQGKSQREFEELLVPNIVDECIALNGDVVYLLNTVNAVSNQVHALGGVFEKLAKELSDFEKSCQNIARSPKSNSNNSTQQVNPKFIDTLAVSIPNPKKLKG